MKANRILGTVSLPLVLLLGGCSKQMPTATTATMLTNLPAASATTATGTYVMKDLGVLSGGVFSTGVGLSPTGLIAGSANRSDGSYVPILWASGSMKQLGSLGGTYGNSTAVNDAGAVVGTSYLSQGGWHAFCYYGGTMKDLGKLSGFSSGAVGINGSGLVVGTGDIYGGGNRGFTWQQGSSSALKMLSTLGGRSCVATAVNGAGLIAGSSNTPGPDPYTEGGPIHACSWTNGVIKDLGTLGGASGTSQALAVSSNGQIAGWTTSTTGNHACVFSAGTIRDLGTITGFKATRATGINAAGTVIGLATNGKYGGNSTRAFVYKGGAISNIHDKVSNLNGWTITQLNAINDAGAIVGVAIVPASVGYGTHGILLTPQ